MTINLNTNLRFVVGDRPGMLHWIMDPEVFGFTIGYSLGDNLVESWNEELCRKTVTAAIGRPIPFDILSHRPWILSRKVSKRYQVGNIFL